jgi:hypothetical protein
LRSQGQPLGERRVAMMRTSRSNDFIESDE